MRGFLARMKPAWLMVAATVGAGIFTLPYATQEAGWGFGIVALVLVSFLVVFVHSLLWDVLEDGKERSDLTGLAGHFFGASGRIFAFAAVLGGLLLTLVAYLILGGTFIGMLVPQIGAWGVVLFWILSSLPMFFKTENFARSEFVGIGILGVMVALLFVTGILGGSAPVLSVAKPSGLFLLFSATLFALAGWTGVGSLVRVSQAERIPRAVSKRGIAWGTAITAILYGIFIFSVLLMSERVSPEAVAGISRGPGWVPLILVVIGLLGMRNSYAPIGLEIQRALRKDVRLSGPVSFGVVLFLPLLLFFAGFKNVIEIIGLVGGVFLSLQYVLIVFVGRAALRLSPSRKFLADFVAVAFISAAIYELYYFVVR